VLVTLLAFSEATISLLSRLAIPPTRLVYLKGPWWGWEAREHATICGVLTGTDASWWESDRCAELIRRRVESLAVGGAAVLWVVFTGFLSLRLVRDAELL
jgi:hypothetical protein